MAIVLEQNSYTRPTEIREDVVQALCDSISKKYLAREQGSGKILAVKIGYRLILKQNGDIVNSYVINKGDVAIRTCEMAFVFRLFQSAGYYIYEFENLQYLFSSKPILGDKGEIEFKIFID